MAERMWAAQALLIIVFILWQFAMVYGLARTPFEEAPVKRWRMIANLVIAAVLPAVLWGHTSFDGVLGVAAGWIAIAMLCRAQIAYGWLVLWLAVVAVVLLWPGWQTRNLLTLVGSLWVVAWVKLAMTDPWGRQFFMSLRSLVVYTMLTSGYDVYMVYFTSRYKDYYSKSVPPEALAVPGEIADTGQGILVVPVTALSEPWWHFWAHAPVIVGMGLGDMSIPAAIWLMAYLWARQLRQPFLFMSVVIGTAIGALVMFWVFQHRLPGLPFLMGVPMLCLSLTAWRLKLFPVMWKACMWREPIRASGSLPVQEGK